MTDYVLRAQTVKYALTGGNSRATLGAPYTGRSVDVGPSYASASEWLAACSISAPVQSQFESMFAAELQFALAVSFAQPLFRGRLLASPPGSSLDFGPSPKAGRGRYNWEGTSALYLCDSIAGVVRELGSTGPGVELWCQEFSLPSSVMLFDGRGLACSSLTAATFWLVEQQRDHDRGPPALGARIADLVKLNFDGMIVPGVRATDALYSNVIVFEPETSWKTFVATSMSPRRAG